jgi:transcriptional regulator with XRE-family HTH domain
MPKKKTTSLPDQVSAPAVDQEGTQSGSQSVPASYPPPEEGIGERIRARREELRLNYEELARLTARCDYWGEKKGLTSAMVARYEKGVDGRPVLPGARELRILCEALYVQPEWLLLGVDRLDQAKGAVRLAKKLIEFWGEVEGFKELDPDAKDGNEWIWRQKLTEIKKFT